MNIFKGNDFRTRTDKIFTLILAADVSVGGDELFVGAGFLDAVVALLEVEFGAVVSYRDPDLHAQAGRFGQTPLEAGEPRAVFDGIIGQDGGADDGRLLETGNDGPVRRSVRRHRQVDDGYGTQDGHHLHDEDDSADASLFRKLWFLLLFGHCSTPEHTQVPDTTKTN